jgi:hypothetical protein
MALPKRGLPENARLPKRARCDYHRAMPTLPNPKLEKFCQHIATIPQTKWPQGRCYTEAGFKTAGRSADACAARLLTRANIKTRIAELLAPTVRKTRTTIDTLAEQFDAVFNGAMGSAQFGAAGSAAAAKSKLLGFMRDKLEVGGPGDFGTCETTEDVVRALLSDQSPAQALELLDTMRGEVERYAADHAEVINVPFVPRMNEVTESLRATRRRN